MVSCCDHVVEWHSMNVCPTALRRVAKCKHTWALTPRVQFSLLAPRTYPAPCLRAWRPMHNLLRWMEDFEASANPLFPMGWEMGTRIDWKSCRRPHLSVAQKSLKNRTKCGHTMFAFFPQIHINHWRIVLWNFARSKCKNWKKIEIFSPWSHLLDRPAWKFLICPFCKFPGRQKLSS